MRVERYVSLISYLEVCSGSFLDVIEVLIYGRIDFSQSFIPHAYIELHMPADPSKPDGYAMDRNHLHIWPRHNFMLIGLPNKVRSQDWKL